MTNDELIARLEAATEIDQRDALISAYIAIHGGDHPEFCSSTRALRFMRMLDVEAYESAALTLVPEEAFGGEVKWDSGGARAIIGFGGIPESQQGNAATPALAIVIAALRTHQKEKH